MLISRQIQGEMTKSLFTEKLRLACKNQVPGHDLKCRYGAYEAPGRVWRPRNGAEREVIQVFVAFSDPYLTLLMLI